MGIRLGYRAGPGLELGLGNGHEVRVSWEGKITRGARCVLGVLRVQAARGAKQCDVMRLMGRHVCA